MRPFTTHTGLVAPDGPVERRYRPDHSQAVPQADRADRLRPVPVLRLAITWTTARDNPEFELNRPEYAGASILLARRNFGCGSSREHAPWALEDYGFRVLLAPSFADIFYNNCFKNGMLPIKLDEATIDDLFARAAAHPGYKLTVDLEKCTITDAFGLSLEVRGRRLPPPLPAERAGRHRADAGARGEDRGLRTGARNRVTCMAETPHRSPRFPIISPTCRWCDLAEQVLDGHRLTPDEGLAMLRSRRRGVARPAGGGLSRAAPLVRQPRRLELSDQRQERAVRRGLRLLLAVAGLEGRDSPLQPGHGRAKFSTAPAWPPSDSAKTYCTVISGRAPTDRELDTLGQVVPRDQSATTG